MIARIAVFMFLGGALAILPIQTPVIASETSTYSYDALGRLVNTSNNGGPRDGNTDAVRYDPAGNRNAVATNQALPTQTNAATFSISAPASANEGQSAIVTVTKSGAASSTLTVSYATANGSAVAPADYAAASGTLSFHSWETAKTVPVLLVDDGIAEPAEQFSMSLSSPSAGATISTGTATVTIAASTAANQPPVANSDALGNVGICLTKQINVVANDTDPEGNYPLSLVSVGTSTLGSASVVSGTDVSFTAYGTPGSGNFSYTVRDSLGATSTGVVTFTVVNGNGCN